MNEEQAVFDYRAQQVFNWNCVYVVHVYMDVAHNLLQCYVLLLIKFTMEICIWFEYSHIMESVHIDFKYDLWTVRQRVYSPLLKLM